MYACDWVREFVCVYVPQSLLLHSKSAKKQNPLFFCFVLYVKETERFNGFDWVWMDVRVIVCIKWKCMLKKVFCRQNQKKKNQRTRETKTSMHIYKFIELVYVCYTYWPPGGINIARLAWHKTTQAHRCLKPKIRKWMKILWIIRYLLRATFHTIQHLFIHLYVQYIWNGSQLMSMPN